MADFYTHIFPNSSIDENWITPTDTPGNHGGDEVFVSFKIFGQKFMALNGGPRFPHSEAVSFQIPCKDQLEINKFWELLLTDGGEESQCGWVKDKFGVSWQVISPQMYEYIAGSDPNGAKRATEAMLKMKKIDLDVLKLAYSGN